ncbi:hypothetical protein BCR33DRAFT_433298 [Rhizoclosmatium globosum]|uniref:Uncharacterized protein n=1 Tax=Rhizoclosmatium globosum TaxID=329046 RepID=A0A1Y2BTQ5_9FUNG|nr:hypothetical protein BCR33DRAFT_433298 [Rhizoclosmatium globosum]|eukprot:ORY38148.1 hypothetical protein BCR33DRAFT_433298 [Rhizoclosmatium globosum]
MFKSFQLIVLLSPLLYLTPLVFVTLPKFHTFAYLGGGFLTCILDGYFAYSFVKYIFYLRAELTDHEVEIDKAYLIIARYGLIASGLTILATALFVVSIICDVVSPDGWGHIAKILLSCVKLITLVCVGFSLTGMKIALWREHVRQWKPRRRQLRKLKKARSKQSW